MVHAYREYRPPADLESLAACLWVNETVRDRPQPVVPDGCVDLVWQGAAGLVIAGADTAPRRSGPLGTPTYGLRLRPGAAGAVLGLPASEVRDDQVPASLVWEALDGPDIDSMAGAEPAHRIDLLIDLVRRRRATPDELVRAAAGRLAVPGARVAGVAYDLGLSERQLRRRTLVAVGYGPKMLARVARLRRLVAGTDGDSLALRAVQAGYASQAHMTEEVRRLTGATPARFLKDAGVTAA